MALCLNFYNATQNGFYLNNNYCKIIKLGESEYTCFCTIKIDNLTYILSFADEVKFVIDEHVVHMWLGNATDIDRNIAHICFQASKDVRILTKAVYERING